MLRPGFINIQTNKHAKARAQLGLHKGSTLETSLPVEI